MTLGEYILHYRTEHDMSIRSFADLAGLSPQYVSNLEKGLNNDGKPLSPTLKTYKKIADATNVTESALLSLVDDFVSINPETSELQRELLQSVMPYLSADNQAEVLEFAKSLLSQRKSQDVQE